MSAASEGTVWGRETGAGGLKIVTTPEALKAVVQEEIGCAIHVVNLLNRLRPRFDLLCDTLRLERGPCDLTNLGVVLDAVVDRVVRGEWKGTETPGSEGQ